MKTTNTKQQMYQAIEAHGANLNLIFNTGIDNTLLCKKLRRLENKANNLATKYCNGEINSHEEFEILTAPILASVRKLLFPNGMTNTPLDWCIIVNGDCRGYALKISDKYVRENNLRIYTDWGGYGILAPEFN